MKKVLSALLVLSAFFVAMAQTSSGKVAPFGTINYIEGSASITRASKVMGEPNIGDAVQPDDLIKTSSDGLVVIDLDKSTGMRGTLTIKPKSTAYVRLQPDSGGAKSTIDLLAGQIGSKLSKLAGNPSLRVTTGNVVMGVRGTAFGVSASVNESVMVYCTEGEVSCADDKEEIGVPAGKSVEKRPSERLRFLPVAISTPEAFEKKWMSDEIDAFRANAPKALAGYQKRYRDLLASFTKEFDPFQKSATLGKWLKEDQSGLKPNSRDPVTLKEKKEMGAYILKILKVLVTFERVYYRMSEVADLVSGTTLEKTVLSNGMTAGDFIRQFKSEAPALERRVALFRFGQRLYALRNEGGAGIPGTESGGDDFFGSDPDFDF